MMQRVETFFESWGMANDAARQSAISSVFASDGSYIDPRTPEALNGPEAVAAYVSMFSANAPGWTAQVIKSDEIGGVLRATIAFGGTGPDGKEMVQHGQYIIEQENGKITRMVGFVGTGEPA